MDFFFTTALVVLAQYGTAAHRVSPHEDNGRITRVECTTTAAPQSFTLDVCHSWAPLGAQRFVDLVNAGFFTDIAMFRCVENFLVQFGIASDLDKKAYWRAQGAIKDDPSLGMLFDRRGLISFAGAGPNTRTTQVFITFRALPFLGKPQSPWEVPFGVVTSGMETVIDHLYTGYGDQQPFNENGVSQGMLQQLGNDYLMDNFPHMSYMKECHVVDDLVKEPVMATFEDSALKDETTDASREEIQLQEYDMQKHQHLPSEGFFQGKPKSNPKSTLERGPVNYLEGGMESEEEIMQQHQHLPGGKLLGALYSRESSRSDSGKGTMFLILLCSSLVLAIGCKLCSRSFKQRRSE